MRTINLLSFDELSDEAKKVAIGIYRKGLEEGKYNADDFGNWAIDDCALLEPLHSEMSDIFGDDYVDKNNGSFMLKNNRTNITFSTEGYRHISFTEAVEITSFKLFLCWLGIPLIYHKHVDVIITDDDTRTPDSIVEFELLEEPTEEVSEYLRTLFDIAEKKFNAHRESVLDGIEKSIASRYEDDAIIDELENSNFEFTEQGKIHKN